MKNKKGEIKKLRGQGFTYEEIGVIMKLTKQRIFQIYSDGKYNWKPPKVINSICCTCKKEFTHYSSHRKRLYCSWKCFANKPSKSKYKTPEEHKKAEKKFQREYYLRIKADPVKYAKFKEKQKQYSRTYMDKLTKDPIRHAERKKEQSRRYHEKRKKLNK